jgi:RNA polymerase sigma-70 factor (ECF subfamily)
VVRIEAHWADLRGQTVPQLLAWARTIAHNVAVDRVRRLGNVAAGEELGDVVACGLEPLELLAGVEEAVRVAAALEQLPPPRREVIVARLFDGLPFEAVAERMGRRCGAVRVLFKRAVEQLRQILRESS